MQRMGNICVTLAAGGPNVVVQDCHEAGQNADAQDKFFLCVALHVACRVTTALLCIALLYTNSFTRWGRAARRAAWRLEGSGVYREKSNVFDTLSRRIPEIDVPGLP